MVDEYDDTYATCKETSALLRIAHPALDPATLSEQLQLTPARAWRKGEPKEPKHRPARIGMWILDTYGVVASRDLRRHLDWLLDHLHDKGAILDQLRQQEYAIDVFSTWVRLGGTGGPMLSPRNMRGLADLSLELQFEFWAVDEDEDEDEDASPP